MDGGEDGGEGVDDDAAVTGEWAKKRTKGPNKSASNVKWTVFAANAKPKSSRGGSSSRPKRTAGGGAAPERILRPNIWAASKSELVFVLPELSQSRSYNGVTDSSSNFPMVLLDDSTADSVAVQV
ncbi:hypothetical protein AX14_011799, partial [Amanita brunnescens Koide BX004]